MMQDNDGYCCLTGKPCEINIDCISCDWYIEYVNERRYGIDG